MCSLVDSRGAGGDGESVDRGGRPERRDRRQARKGHGRHEHLHRVQDRPWTGRSTTSEARDPPRPGARASATGVRSRRRAQPAMPPTASSSPPATRGNGLDRHTQRRSTAHLAPVAKAEGDKLGNTATRTRPRSRRPPTRLRSHKFRPRLCTKARVVSKR